MFVNFRLMRGGLVLGAGLALTAFAAGQSAPAKKPATKPAAIDPNVVRPVPAPATQPIPEADRTKLLNGLAELSKLIADIQTTHANNPDLLARLPDVQIYQNAIFYPLQYNDPIDPKQGLKLLADGIERAKQLKDGKHPWSAVSGPRGYVSRIDGSVQPYILSIPPDWKPGNKPLPLALSCHGRNEKLTEAVFLSSKVGEGNAGNSTVGDPKTKFVVYLYGRYCNANKMAGEIDLFEAWGDVRQRYPIDETRVAVTGFSMGGGAVWHLAAHYGENWVCATPGAGFSESERFLKLKENGEVPPWYEAALYKLYNATDHAENFFNCKTISYAGDKDGQKQAGDVMEEAMAKIGLKLERFTGPDTAHKYEPKTKAAMDARVEELVKAGREATPKRVWFSTYTLRYPSMRWVRVLGLERHWSKAIVDAEVVGLAEIKVATKNVSRLELSAADAGLREGAGKWVATIDGVRLDVADHPNRLGRRGEFEKVNGIWKLIEPGPGHFSTPGNYLKQHRLQGPIDDAFLDSFLIVKPADGAADATVPAAAWATGACERAGTEWRRQFRGEARVKPSHQVTDADISAHNLVLFGTPETNPLMAKILPNLPITWTKEKLIVNGQEFDARRYVPVMIYPNPLNPTKYVVLNSGFTFREADYLNNARQTPKLPDYAVVDVQNPPTPKGWGKLPKAGFFGENWEWLKDDGKLE
jgi:pimeloyl-ACP methyl ester carboxylesterase